MFINFAFAFSILLENLLFHSIPFLRHKKKSTFENLIHIFFTVVCSVNVVPSKLKFSSFSIDQMQCYENVFVLFLFFFRNNFNLKGWIKLLFILSPYTFRLCKISSATFEPLIRLNEFSLLKSAISIPCMCAILFCCFGFLLFSNRNFYALL